MGSKLRVSAFDVPTSSRESDGTLAWDRTVLVTVEITTGSVVGFGYSYADVSSARFVIEHLARIALEADPTAVGAAFAAMEVAVRNLGREGVAATAIAAVDMALWDRKAKMLGRSFVELVGRRRTDVAAYASGGFTSYSLGELHRRFQSLKSAGFSRFKMKIGRGDSTIERVRAAREAVGPQSELFVDANGAFDRKEALAVASELAPLGVSWLEEPVSSDDLEGLRFMRDRAPATMSIAAGEYGYTTRYFDRMLGAGAVDVLQADATRCGVSGFLQVAALCDAKNTRLSAHCAPTVHAHLGCVTPRTEHVEYFHDHVRIEEMVFQGAVSAVDGKLTPDPLALGFGVTLKRSAADSYRVYDETTEGEK